MLLFCGTLVRAAKFILI